MSEGKTTEAKIKLKPTLKEFTRIKENFEAYNFVFSEGPKEYWGYIYDTWSETVPLLHNIFENKITKDEVKNYIGAKIEPDKPHNSIDEAVEKFKHLEDIQDKLVRLEDTDEAFEFTSSLTPAVRFLSYIKSQSSLYFGQEDYFKELDNALNMTNNILTVIYFLSDTAKMYHFSLDLSFIYSNFAAVSLNNLSLAYQNLPPDDREREKLQDTLTEEINGVMQNWLDNGIDFLNISHNVPSEFKGNLIRLKHLRNVGSTLSIPTGVIGKDLEEMIDENAFADEAEIHDRNRFLLLCNLRYLLETTHDTYIDEEYREKYSEVKN